MIQFYESVSHRANTAAVFLRLQKAVQNHRRAILLVPEHLSHEMERQLCEVCGNTACRWVEVLSFSRLADRVFRAEGDAGIHPIDQGGRVLLMYRAIQDLQSRLFHFHPGKIRLEFLLQLLDLSSEFHRSAITPELLHQASNAVDGYLAEKLSELSLILQQYEAISQAEGIDPSQRLSRLAAMLPDSALLDDTEILIDGFTCFSEQEESVVEQLCLCGSALILTLPMGEETDGLFAPAARAKRALIRFLERAGESFQTITIPSEAENALTHLRDHLMRAAPGVFSEKTDAIQLAQYPNAYEECLGAAGWIANQVRQGRRYRDIQVACTEMERYGPVLEAVFQRFSIPVAMARTEAAVSKPLAVLITAALDCAAYDLDHTDVIRYLKSGYAPVSADMCDRLENYAITWNLRGQQWLRPWKRHPDGYGQTMDARSEQQLEALNAARETALTPLSQLCSALRQATDGAEMVTALYSFCEQLQVPKRLQDAVNAMTPQNRQAAMEDTQLYEVFLTALEQIHEVLGTSALDLPTFSTLVKLMLQQYRVGAIPPAVDCVSVGAISMMRQKSPKCLLVLGAQEGSFPHYQVSDGILSDQERELLRRKGLGAFRCHTDDTGEELLAIYNLVAAPTEVLRVSCVAGGEGASYLFRRISGMFPQVPIGTAPEIPEIWYMDSKAAGMLIAMSDTQPAYAAVGNMLRALPLPAVQEAAGMLRTAREKLPPLSPDSVSSLYGKRIYLSASRVDQYALCRCSFFYRYGMKAKPRRTASFDAPIYGTFVHAVLENLVTQVMAQGGFETVEQEEAHQMTEHAVAQFLQENAADFEEQPARSAYLFSRNLREVRAVAEELWRELHGSKFQPAACELEFSDQGTLPSVIVEGSRGSGAISGFVDRVDVFWRDQIPYVRVVDYKTGPKELDYTDLLEGIGLQMLLYLFALAEHGEKLFGVKPQPAGVLYVPARQKVLRDTSHPTPERAAELQDAQVRRSGILTSDEELLSAMEQFTRQARYLPILARNSGKYLANPAQMDALREFVRRTLESLLDQILGGEIAPNPYVRGPQHNPCTYCDYAAACHLDAAGNACRSRKRVSAEAFWQEIMKGESDDGKAEVD